MKTERFWLSYYLFWCSRRHSSIVTISHGYIKPVFSLLINQINHFILTEFQVGHTRRVEIPDCVAFQITTNACRGICESW